jgi:hypothetical protein
MKWLKTLKRTQKMCLGFHFAPITGSLIFNFYEKSQIRCTLMYIPGAEI